MSRGAVRGGHDVPAAESANVIKTLFKLVRYIFSHHKFKVMIMFASVLVSAYIDISLARSIGTLIDEYVMPLIGQANPDFSGVIAYVARIGGMFAVGTLSAMGLTFLGAIVSQRTLTDLRKSLFAHMQNLGISYFDTHSNGEIMGLYTNDLDAIVEVVSQSIPQFLSVAVTVISIFVVMCMTDMILTCFVIAYVFIIYAVAAFITRRSKVQHRKNLEYYGKYNGFVEESIYSQKIVKVFSHEDESRRDFAGYVENVRRSACKAVGFANIFMPLLANIGNLLYVVLVSAGVIFMTTGALGLTIGGLVTFLQLTRSFTGPMSQISIQLNSLVQGAAGAERIFRFLDVESENYSGNTCLRYVLKDDAGNVVRESDSRFEGSTPYWKRVFEDADPQYVELMGDVRFFDVSFSYDGVTDVLSGISLYAKPGQKIALVGSTGAGKTTIISLISRFYDVSSGKITIDGIDIRDIRKDELRKSIAVVLQETHLFTGTISENIRYGNLNASDEDVRTAAGIAHADSFIKALKDGYDTMISGTDSQLSEGQKQLLNIARAAIADPPILILDEATSSVDSASEKYVGRAMDRIMEGRTVFVIAHRLSTIRDASVILVLEHGKVIERGSHEELLALKGRYYRLYTGSAELS